MSRNSRIGARLRALAALVPPGSRVADVGTGHALLPLFLRRSGRAAHCVATERSPTTLAVLRRRAAAGRTPEGIELRAGDGLQALSAEDRIDVLVLAGLGARKMIRILEDRRLDSLRPRRLVLQPQSETARLETWLARRGYRVVASTETWDRGRAYRVLAVERPLPAKPRDSGPLL